MVNSNESAKIINLFPNIKLSYDNLTHKKVYRCNFAFAIPVGKKYFAWFSKNDQQQNICIFMEVTKDKNISNLQVENIETNTLLTHGKGTIFYGTIFSHNERFCFAIENIFYDQGINISNFTMEKKLFAIHKILTTSFQTILNKILYLNSTILFGFPLIYSEFTPDMNAAIRGLPYKVAHIQFHDNNKPNMHYTMNYIYRNCNTNFNYKSDAENQVVQNKNFVKDVVFRVVPDLQNDIYNLYALDDSSGKEYLYNTAYISDYKTSVMMNGLFRNIKENTNLDALEESDDEDEFENDKIDKFVDLQKSYNMVCIFNYKFKKWSPIKIAQINSSIVKKNHLIRLEKNKY